MRAFRRILHPSDFSRPFAVASRPRRVHPGDHVRRASARPALLRDFGVPAEQIARVAKSRHADVIVMGTHGRTGLTRAFLGSVAARVVAIAGCPVLTVHA